MTKVSNNGDTIRSIQKQIVKALESETEEERQRKSAPLFKALAEVRAKDAEEKERAEVQRVVDARQALRDRAEAVKAKVEKQDRAIDKFLELRDTLVSQLQLLIEPMREMARMQSMNRDGPGECYSGFNDISQFAAEVRSVPQGYLPANFGCPFLEMAGGQVDALGKASEAYSYFMSALGILTGLQKGISTLPLRPAEGLMAVENDDEPESEARNCIVCSHPEVEAINNLLRQGKPLRDIESEFGVFGVSRSSLSRHKNNCLNLGAIRIHD